MPTDTGPTRGGGSGRSVISRVVHVLEAFSPDDEALTVSEIARRSGLHVATASRLIAELVAHGLLTRDADRRVRTGVRLWELALRASPALTLRDAAMAPLEDLHAVVGHHVQLSVLDGDGALFIERLSAPGAVVNVTRVAGRLPLHVASSGWVLLAHAPADVRDRVLSGPLPRFTAASVADAVRLRAELAQTRAQGFALLPGHVHPEATGIAVPVRDPAANVVAALSVIVPNTPEARAVVPALQAASRATTRRLRPAAAGTGTRPLTQ